MSDFNLVWAEFWPEALARGWSDDMRQCALYLLTSKHREIAGLYHLPIAYAADDLGWTLDRTWCAIDALILDSFIAYDERARVVLIRKALKRLAPEGPKQIKGAVASVQKLPTTSLIVDLTVMAETHSEGFAEALRGSVETLSEGYPTDGIRRPDTPSVNVDGDIDQDVDGDHSGSSATALLRRTGERNVVAIERATTSGEAA